MLYNLTERKININGLETDYISFGKGQRPLIMIQGLNTNGIKGAGLGLALAYSIFAKDFKVYLFDRRPVLHKGITVKEMADDIASAMDSLGLKNACILGVSQGGMIAQYLAVERPDLVYRLVLAVTIARTNEIVAECINGWVEMTEKDDYKALVRDMAEKMYSDKYLKQYKPMLPLLTLMQKPKDKERFITLARSCLSCDIYNQLDKIHCPTLVIGGGQDKIVGREASLEIAEKLKCECYIYEELGHACYEEAPDFNKRVYDFFTK